MAKPIRIPGTALVEITRRCYCGCRWCYKGKTVHSKGAHLPLDLIKSRIRWIADNVECNSIYLIGGEPLLHPDFAAIIEYIAELGYTAGIITSGRISGSPLDWENYQAALGYYERGVADIEVSFQNSFNDRHFIRTVGDLRKRFEARREALKAKGRFDPKHMDMFTTVVVDEAFVTPDDLKKLVEKVHNIVYGEGLGENIVKFVDETSLTVKNHFADFDESERVNFTIYSGDDWTGFRAKVRFMGKITINYLDGYSTVLKPKGGNCDAFTADIEDGVTLQSLTVRDDGHVTFSKPECITAATGLCNVDIHSGENAAAIITASVKAIRESIIAEKRRQAKTAADYCDEDPDYEEADSGPKCSGCPFIVSCNMCHLIPREWGK